MTQLVGDEAHAVISDKVAIRITSVAMESAEQALRLSAKTRNHRVEVLLFVLLFLRHYQLLCEENLLTHPKRKSRPSHTTFKNFVRSSTDEQVACWFASQLVNVSLSNDWRDRILNMFKSPTSLQSLLSSPMSNVLELACLRINGDETNENRPISRRVLFSMLGSKQATETTLYELCSGSPLASPGNPDELRVKTSSSGAALPTQGISALVRAIENCRSVEGILLDVRTYLERTVFPHIAIRVGFAEKVLDDNSSRYVLKNQRLTPFNATGNAFSYPQTLAAWSLIEGEILAWPKDQHRVCDFDCLRRLGKLERIKEELMKTGLVDDHVLSRYLNPSVIRRKTDAGDLTLSDLYQDWVGNQPKKNMAHYRQFISVPVPIIDYVSNQLDIPEYGVFNIDTTTRDEELLNDRTRPLLEIASRLTRVGIEYLRNNQYHKGS